jgi:uncharacterized protein involved in outer membrane biogenesis
MSKLRKIVIWVAAFLVFFTIVGFFALPPLVKHLLTKNLSEALHRDVSINQIKVNPYTLTIAIKGFAVKERGTAEVFLSFEELFANIQAISIFRWATVVDEIKLTKPYIRVIRDEDGTYNFDDLLDKSTAETEAPAKKSRTIEFSINNITIGDGSIDFLDTPKEVFHEITSINLAVPFISNMRHHVEKTYVQPRFSALVNGDPFAIEGKTKPFTNSLETEFDININDLDLADYLGYVPAHKKFKLLSGALDLTGKMAYIQHEDKGPDLTVIGKLTLRDIDLADENSKPLWKVIKTEFDIASLKPFEALIHLSRVDIQSPEINMRRNKDGTIDVFTLMGLLAGTAEKQEEAKASSATKDTKPMSILVDTWQTKDGKIRFLDSMPQQPVTIEINNAELEAKDVSLAKDSKAAIQFSFLLGKSGKVNGKGTVGLEPLTANLSVDVKVLGINAFQPYFTDKVRVYISSGSINTSGALAVSKPEGKDMTARYTGKLLINQFNATDKEDFEELLRWQTLSLESLDFNYNPMRFSVKGISLSDFFAAITIESDGTLNLHQLTVADEQAAKPDEKIPQKDPAVKAAVPSEPSLPANVEIGGITLQGGTIKFTDKYIKPSYSANLTQIGGRVSSLSMKKDTAADVEVRGKFNDYVPLEITGKVNPWKEHFFVDLTASSKNFELSPLSPYSGKYVGYTIDKGQLSFDLKYLIVQRKLESQNRILLDQFTFGDKVESPDATKLPVRLAIALLKDRKGQINLDIPVSGNIDDPKFSIWKVVWQIIGNLLTKAATSPFALLGALFGGGEELSYLEFDYGRANLTEPNLKKLDTIVKALDDRPTLKLDIQGQVDVERDTEGLKNYLVQRKVKSQKLKELTKKGSEAVPVDEVKVEPTEYEKYLRMAYNAEKFPKPRNIVGLAKSLPVPEMEKLMLTNTAVKDEDLRTLANQRATNTKDALLKSGKITSDRVFLVEAKTLTPEKKENIKNARVDFKLK